MEKWAGASSVHYWAHYRQNQNQKHRSVLFESYGMMGGKIKAIIIDT